MRVSKGPLYREMSERIVVYRYIPADEQDRSIAGNLKYRSPDFPRREWQEIIPDTDNLKICIVKTRLKFDEMGIATSQSDYGGTVIPPNHKFSIGDVIIRIDRGMQDLYITGITQGLGVQRLELNNRTKSENAQY